MSAIARNVNHICVYDLVGKMHPAPSRIILKRISAAGPDRIDLVRVRPSALGICVT